MDYIGYTSCIAGDAVLSYLHESNDIRYDEEKEELDDEVLEDYTLYQKNEIKELDEDKLEDSIFEKDVSYFFEGTLDEYELDDAKLYIEGSELNRSFDASYPDESKLSSLFVMKDYGNQNQAISKMWQQIKNRYLPLYVYIIAIAIVSGLVTLVIINKVKKSKEYKARKLAREEKLLAK